MRNTGKYVFWDIILVEYEFAEWTGSKLRPVVVLFRDMDDYTILKMTTKGSESNDALALVPDDENCLKSPTYIKMGKINTFHETLFLKRIGKISSAQRATVKKYLMEFIGKL